MTGLDMSTVARVLGAIILLLSLFYIRGGRICFHQIYRILLFWREKPLEEVEKELSGSVIHREILRAFKGLSAGRGFLRQELPKERFEFDTSRNRIIDAVQITIFRWCDLTFFVGLGLILSGSLWWIVVLAMAWIVTFGPFCQVGFYRCLMATIGGWFYGGSIFSYFPYNSKLWYGASHAIGILFMFMALLLIEIILWYPHVSPLKKEKLEDYRRN
jgi:hypothetical protein